MSSQPYFPGRGVSTASSSGGFVHRFATKAQANLDKILQKQEVEVLLALLCLGELGRRVDVTTAAAEAVAAELTTDRASESVKAAASFALGGIAAGNPAAYLR